MAAADDDQAAAPRPDTGLIHHPYRPPAGFDSPAPGVYKASTVIFPNVAALRSRNWKNKTGYTYGLHGTPTTFVLEERLATLEGGRYVQLAPSGLAAIAMVNAALLKQGDEVLLPDNVYGPNLEFARSQLAAWGITHKLYDPLDAGSLERAIGRDTRLVWLEAAGSVTLEFPDLLGLMRVIRRHPQVVAALDNTWGAGLAFKPFDLPGGLGVDLSLHALTKYPSGGGDVLMGSVTAVDEALHLKIQLAHMRLGFGVGANDVELVLRGLPSLALRYAAHDRATRALAAWWQQRPEAVQVLHPALPGSPGHEHWAALCTSAAGLLSIVFDARWTPAQVDAFVDALKLFKIGYSWGGPMSLAVPYEIRKMRSLPWPHAGTLVRLCVGLEAVEDLIADCEQALAAMAAGAS
ncbi:MAG: cystathionine beta-lyase [Aquabacterium sp.]|nr:MAG: cystathionine beta-lyase [Aquabacterium sp.]